MGSAKPVEQESLLERFRRDFDALADPSMRVGVAVSGGPDSLALLNLAAAARPGQVEAASVDHALRAGSGAEAEMVAGVCEKLGVPHRILTLEWPNKPKTAIQERARMQRYASLGSWARERQLGALVTAHHLDDQVETLIMRLARGAGVRGLAGMRRSVRTPGGRIVLLRPLLGWRHAELEQVCAEAGLTPAIDPSNDDDQFERVRVRKALAAADWLDPAAIARSAVNLGQADAALNWAANQEWIRSVVFAPDGHIIYSPGQTPREIRRRIVRRAVLRLASEGRGADLRGAESDQLLAFLSTGRRATLRGVLCIGGDTWRFSKAPARKG